MVQVQPKADGIALLYTSIVLLGLSWVTFVIRMGLRSWKQILGMDDLAMAIGLLLFTVTASLCIVCSFYGSGQYAVELPASTRAQGIKLFFIAEFFYAAGACAIKCSIAITLMRIVGVQKAFVWGLWFIMGASFASSVIFIAGIANICHPINTLWGEAHGVCNLKLNSDVSFFFSAVEIVTDCTLAILPWILLRNIQMKFTVKISVVVILGMAALASCATIVRLRYLSMYSDPVEFMYATGKIGLWSIIEEGTGIFAGSLPALRPLLSLSFLSGGRSSTLAFEADRSNDKKFSKRRSGRYQASEVDLDRFQHLRDSDTAVDEDGESQKHILRQTRFKVTNEKNVTGQEGDWERSQVLGWQQSGYRGKSEVSPVSRNELSLAPT
ncbi:hypothetical protein FKW77_010094 [Venturia effusa]|uniref:Rhodopsin domain-containing protein n=1 Tax=Venturia effusa TaxID=50376 RepID=A0A517L6D1_9PEZI|nr:hypothetical protein FKW77_010094 [Venturia effusa]